jgi:hypothetical protein
LLAERGLSSLGRPDITTAVADTRWHVLLFERGPG